jgi:hypothetical protein
MNIFELFKNKNWSSNICPPTGFSQFLSLGFKNFADSIEKSHFFQKKKKKKIKISKLRRERKKKTIGRINVQKIIQIGDGHWSLGRFL